MKPTFNEKLIAYLTLLSGLSISAVAVYYSVVGLTAIFAAAVIPIIIMGTTLEISKLVATVWLKQNWTIAPKTVRAYLLVAILVLMFITSMGIFGFLSKAHSDQSLVSGDALAKLSIIDEKIKTAKENINANRNTLTQMDQAVDQTMSRSTSEQGADKAVAIRRSQQKERTRLLSEIDGEQKTIARLNEERAPIAADVRKVEAEVGPLKYIAAFIYGETDQTVLEKSVTWVIITLIVVFDPLAVILLLASQISFQNFRERQLQSEKSYEPDVRIADVGEPPKVDSYTDFFPDKDENIDKVITDEEPEVDQWNKMIEEAEKAVQKEKEESILDKHPYLKKPWAKFKNKHIQPAEADATTSTIMNQVIDWTTIPPEQEYITVNGQQMNVRAARHLYPPKKSSKQ